MTVAVQYSNEKDREDSNTLASAIRKRLSTDVQVRQVEAAPGQPDGLNFQAFEAVFVVGGQNANPTYQFLVDNDIVPPLEEGRTEVIGNGIVKDADSNRETPVFAVAGLLESDTDKLVNAMTTPDGSIATQALDAKGINALTPGIDPFEAVNSRLGDIFQVAANVLPTDVTLTGIKTEPQQDRIRFFVTKEGFSLSQPRQQLLVSSTVAATIAAALGAAGVTYTVMDIIGMFTGSKEVAETPSEEEVSQCRENNDTSQEIQECLEGKIETRPAQPGDDEGTLDQIEDLVVLGVGGVILLQVTQNL